MANQRKFKDFYPAEEKSNEEMKKEIQTCIVRINKLLEEPEKQKKAAEILSHLINNSK